MTQAVSAERKLNRQSACAVILFASPPQQRTLRPQSPQELLVLGPPWCGVYIGFIFYSIPLMPRFTGMRDGAGVGAGAGAGAGAGCAGMSRCIMASRW